MSRIIGMLTEGFLVLRDLSEVVNVGQLVLVVIALFLEVLGLGCLLDLVRDCLRPRNTVFHDKRSSCIN
jgi:hypothetical protein